MSRGPNENFNNHLAGDSFIAYTLIEIDVHGGSTLKYTDAPYDIEAYFGGTYLAQGNFLGYSEASETADLQITNINLIFTALDITSVRQLCNSNQINQTVSIRRVFVDPSDSALSLITDSSGVIDTIDIFEGSIGGYRIEDAEDTATVTIEVNSQFTNFDRRNGRRSSLKNFQREHPTDFGMEYSHESMLDIKWGKK